MSVRDLAGKPAPRDLLANIPRLVSRYYVVEPDPSDPTQRVAFGTSGHRGSSATGSFNEQHILAVSQAICDYRAENGINGPLFMGMDTHALSEPAFSSAVEVFAANSVSTFIQSGGSFTPTPAVSFAILEHNREHPNSPADGVVITPSHNPPEDGGFKYNPPNGGPADTIVTRDIQDRANVMLESGLKGIKRMPVQRAMTADCVHEYDLCRALCARPGPSSRHGRHCRVQAFASASTPWAARA